MIEKRERILLPQGEFVKTVLFRFQRDINGEGRPIRLIMDTRELDKWGVVLQRAGLQQMYRDVGTDRGARRELFPEWHIPRAGVVAAIHNSSHVGGFLYHMANCSGTLAIEELSNFIESLSPSSEYWSYLYHLAANRQIISSGYDGSGLYRNTQTVTFYQYLGVIS